MNKSLVYSDLDTKSVKHTFGKNDSMWTFIKSGRSEGIMESWKWNYDLVLGIVDLKVRLIATVRRMKTSNCLG